MIKGSVNTDSQGTTVAEKRTITFEKAGEVTFNMEPVPQNADMEIHNRIIPRDDSLTSHIYTQNVSFTSHGVNENIEFNIEMYPGMYLNEMGALYDSSGNLVDSSRYQIDYNVTKVHDPNGEKGNGRFVKINIGSMSDGETFVWRGTVGVIPDMYEENTANAYINSDESLVWNGGSIYLARFHDFSSNDYTKIKECKYVHEFQHELKSLNIDTKIKL